MATMKAVRSLTAEETAKAAGFDMTLIEANLRCTYEQRALQHQAALDLALELQRVGERLRGGPESTPAKQGHGE